MADFNTVASDAAIEQTQKALESNGFAVTVVETGAAARQAVLDLIPKGSEVFSATSKTTDDIGLSKIIDESGNYDAVRPKLNAMYGDDSKARERRKLGAAPDYAIGSVQAITQDGHLLIASNTGSQLPAYLYGAGQVIWVVGAQKITKNFAEAEERLKQYVTPLENERAKIAYGFPTSVNKLVHYYKEINPARAHIVIVKQSLGF